MNIPHYSQEKLPGEELQHALHSLRERVKELNCLYDITRLSQRQNLPLEEIFAGAAEIVARAWQYPEVTCVAICTEGTCHRTSNFGAPVSRQSSPILVGGDAAGHIEVGYLDFRPPCDEGPFLAEERRLLDAVAELIARIIEAKQSEARANELSQELIKAHEQERQRIARELHDNVAQDLSMLRMGVETLSTLIPSGAPKAEAWAAEASSRLGMVIASVRDLSYALLPPALDQLGLVEAAFRYCDEFSSRHGVQVEFFADGMDSLRVDFKTGINLYRILQESLANVRKHSQARRVTVCMVASHPFIILTIEDDGLGFDPKQRTVDACAGKRMGLWSMRERALLLGGRMSIRSRLGAGTRIFVEVPCGASE